MSNTKPAKKAPGKDSVIIYIVLAFVAGFISGAAFAVYKTVPSDTPAVTGQSQIAEEQAQHIAHLEEDVAADPENFQAWAQLCNLYFDTSQYEKAVNAYQRSLEFQPDNPDVWTDLGVMYRRNKQPDKAIEAFNQAIEVDPSHEISRINKGIVLLYDLNDPQGAITSWENLLKINPGATTGSGNSIREFVDQLKQDMEKQEQ